MTCPDSPEPDAFGSIVFVPIRFPSANETATNASHPKVAVFQWEALQRPIRAARFLLFLAGDTAVLLSRCWKRNVRRA